MNNLKKKNAVDDQRNTLIEDLKRQYPWFNESEITEVVQRFEFRHERILAYLDMKSGRWSLVDIE